MSSLNEILRFTMMYKVKVHAYYYDNIRGKRFFFYSNLSILVMATAFIFCSCKVNQAETSLTEGKWYCDATDSFLESGVDGTCECTLLFKKENDNRNMLLRIDGEYYDGIISMKFSGSIRGTWEVDFDTLIMNLSPNTIRTKVFDVECDVMEENYDESIKLGLISELKRVIESIMIGIVQDVEKKQGKSNISINNGKLTLVRR